VQEAELNRHEHRTVDIDGITLHFVQARSGGIPLLLLHGWPSCFVEQLALVPHLAADFDLVVPSLPGYGFSQRPPIANYRIVAGLFHQLMQHLGHDRYAVHGGDFGAGVATYLALDHPDAVLGIHLSTPEILPVLGPSSPALTRPERDYLALNDAWAEVERGYSAIQSTKPQTLGSGRVSGDPAARFGRDC
jgi:pimeloyl-ACP methyl ester carboxylesterase